MSVISSSRRSKLSFVALLSGVIIAAYFLVGTETGRSPAAQMTLRLLAVSTAATIVIGAAMGIEWRNARIQSLTSSSTNIHLADAVADVSQANSGMNIENPVKNSIDHPLAMVQNDRDSIQGELRRARREITHLSSILETISNGVIVLNTDGHTIFVNDAAKRLLNGIDIEKSSPFSAWMGQEAVTLIPQAQYAPGLYALGDPRQVEAGGRILRAQMAELRSIVDQQVGRIILLSDITDEVRRERAHAALLKGLQAIQTPLAERSGMFAANLPPQRFGETDDALRQFSREMVRHAAGLQRLIVEMRDLTIGAIPDVDGTVSIRAIRSISAETLIWTLANEWRQVATAADVRMDVQIEAPGLMILGDERRLRWALGNLIDNAIKYTLPGGACSLEVKGETDGMVRLRVRDNGVGIAREELERVYIPFYRGTPKTRDGEMVIVPGMGQGLSTAKAIIEAHGGTIRVQSVEGSGTAVNVALPLTTETPLSIPMNLNAGDTMRMSPINVLLSHFAEIAQDDDDQTRMIEESRDE